MCHRTESMNVLSAVSLPRITLPFSVIGIGKERMIYMYVSKRKLISTDLCWMDRSGPPSPPPHLALFLQFVTVLLHTGLPLEQMWPSTVVWPLRYTSCYIDVRWHVSAIYKNEYCSFFYIINLRTTPPPSPPNITTTTRKSLNSKAGKIGKVCRNVFKRMGYVKTDLRFFCFLSGFFLGGWGVRWDVWVWVKWDICYIIFF